jgi:hypothetical protein
MDGTSASKSIQTTYEPSAIDFASTSERSYVLSHEAATNATTNGNPDGCEQASLRLTSVDELLQVEHWKPAEPQFCKEIAAHYGQSKRNIQKWFVDLREIAPWLSEAELRLSNDRYTPFAVEILGDRYFAGSKKKWASVLAERFAERAESWNSVQSAPAIRTEVLPQEENQPHGGDRPDSYGGMASYQRSSALNTLLNSRPQIDETSTPEQNPLVLAIHQKVTAMTTTTASVRQQLAQVRQMTADTHEAIQSLEDLAVVERAQAKADRHYQLEKQVYTRRLEELGVEDVLGKPPIANAQPQSA